MKVWGFRLKDGEVISESLDGDRLPKVWGFRLKDGEVISELFDGDRLPKGYVDTPAKLKKPKGEE